MTVIIRRPVRADFNAWADLYRGYGKFYNTAMPDSKLSIVWSWIMSDHHELECVLACLPDGKVIGLLHFRRMSSPLDGADGGYLDDMFVDPSVRKSGAAKALMAYAAEIARERKWVKVRWLTADDNYTARGLYDQIGRKRHDRNVYELNLTPPARL